MIKIRDESKKTTVKQNNNNTDFKGELLNKTQAGQGIIFVNNGNNQIVEFGFNIMAIKEENGDINDYLVFLGELKVKLTKNDVIKIGFSV